MKVKLIYKEIKTRITEVDSADYECATAEEVLAKERQFIKDGDVGLELMFDHDDTTYDLTVELV